jgi:hypothetical protein
MTIQEELYKDATYPLAERLLALNVPLDTIIGTLGSLANQSFPMGLV